MRYIIIILFGLCSYTAAAQLDFGAAGGTYVPYFRDVDLKEEGHQICAALFYRERVADHTDISIEVHLTNRRLSGAWTRTTDGSMIKVHASDLWLQHVYMALLFDVRMIPSGNVMIRFGPQFGLKVVESFTGTVREYSDGSVNGLVMDDLKSSRTDFFRNEQRFYAGLGFRVPLTTRFGMVVDPYFSAGMSRLLREPRAGMSNEVGMRVGIARRFHGRGLKQRAVDGYRKRAAREDIVP